MAFESYLADRHRGGEGVFVEVRQWRWYLVQWFSAVGFGYQPSTDDIGQEAQWPGHVDEAVVGSIIRHIIVDISCEGGFVYTQGRHLLGEQVGQHRRQQEGRDCLQ